MAGWVLPVMHTAANGIPLGAEVDPKTRKMLLLELVLLLLLCAVALGWIARHFKFPYPIALVVGGALLGLIGSVLSIGRFLREALVTPAYRI